MARRKRYIKGRVYFTTDKLLIGGKGKTRRVVSMGNDKTIWKFDGFFLCMIRTEL